MSAWNPFTMFVAWVVLPPKDNCQMSDWPSCASFQSFAKFEVILPYATYGLLYAASVMTGVSAGVHAVATTLSPGLTVASVSSFEPRTRPRPAPGRRVRRRRLAD